MYIMIKHPKYLGREFDHGFWLSRLFSHYSPYVGGIIIMYTHYSI